LKAASQLAGAFLQDCWNSVQMVPWATPVLAITEPLTERWRRRLGIRDDAQNVWLQGGGDLGARLERVLRKAIAAGGTALALGADSPGLPRDRLESARHALRQAEATLGRSEDGGFYLLGLRRCPEGLLAGMTWSAPETAAQVLESLRRHGMTVAEVEPWFDVDRPDDLQRLRQALRSRQASPAPHTEALLRQLAKRPAAPASNP
jgi:glycosyltransferase A (GT-A) superfamily protein (DUF2064 family)